MEWHALGWVAVALYAGAEDLSIRALVQPRGLAPVPLLMAVGLALHFADLELVGRALHSVPYRTIGGSMSLFGWVLGVSYAALLFRHRNRAIRPLLIPLVILF